MLFSGSSCSSTPVSEIAVERCAVGRSPRECRHRRAAVGSTEDHADAGDHAGVEGPPFDRFVDRDAVHHVAIEVADELRVLDADARRDDDVVAERHAVGDVAREDAYVRWVSSIVRSPASVSGVVPSR